MLIKCPQCKRYLTDKSASCPHCGYVIKNDSASESVKEPVPGSMPAQAPKPTLGAMSESEIESIPKPEIESTAEPIGSSEMTEVSQYASPKTIPVDPKQKMGNSNFLLFVIIVVLIVLVGCIGGYLYFDRVHSTNMADHDSDISSKNDIEIIYSTAMNQISSENDDSLRQGVMQMEELSNKNYIPAMFQMAFTYGWFSDNSSVRRKKLLGIPIKENGMPISGHYNRIAIGLFSKIVELNDSSYAAINAQSCYRMAGYYIEKNNVQVQDYAAGKQWLLRAKEWGKLSPDQAELLKSIDKGLSLIEAYEHSIDNSSSL